MKDKLLADALSAHIPVLKGESAESKLDRWWSDGSKLKIRPKGVGGDSEMRCIMAFLIQYGGTEAGLCSDADRLTLQNITIRAVEAYRSLFTVKNPLKDKLLLELKAAEIYGTTEVTFAEIPVVDAWQPPAFARATRRT